MEVQRAVFIVMLGFTALASLAIAKPYILTPKMLGNFNPTSGLVLSPGTPSGKKNVGYQAFDRKRYNKVPMYCAANDGCQPIELIFEFPDMNVRCKNYKLYVASDIPVEQKPLNWTLQCQEGPRSPWQLLDTNLGFDWSNTEVYETDLSEHPLCKSYMLTVSNPVSADGAMIATISELMLYGEDG